MLRTKEHEECYQAGTGEGHRKNQDSRSRKGLLYVWDGSIQHKHRPQADCRRDHTWFKVLHSPPQMVSKQLFERGWAEMVPVGFVSNPAWFCCSSPNNFQSLPDLLYIYFNAEAVALSSSCSLCRIINKTLACHWLTFPLPMSSIAFWKEFSAFYNVMIHKIWGHMMSRWLSLNPAIICLGGCSQPVNSRWLLFDAVNYQNICLYNCFICVPSNRIQFFFTFGSSHCPSSGLPGYQHQIPQPLAQQIIYGREREPFLEDPCLSVGWL